MYKHKDISHGQALAHLRKTKLNGIAIPEPERVSTRRKLDVYLVSEIALESWTRGEFAKKDKSAYNWAQRHGLLDVVCQHMDSGRY